MDDAPMRVNEELPIHRFITQAQERIEKGEFKRGLGSLELALWELHMESSTDEYDSVRGLAARVSEQTRGPYGREGAQDHRSGRQPATDGGDTQ
jgi:hypothetical protein